MTNKLPRIDRMEVCEWSLPLLAPFRVAKRTAYNAHNVLVRIFDDRGNCGCGAAAPVEYITGETQQTTIEALTEVSRMIEKVDVSRLGPMIRSLGEMLPSQPSARAAIEMAFFDLWAKRWSIPLWQHFGGFQNSLLTDITIPIVTPEEARDLTKDALSDGFSVFKIKIGDSNGHEVDLARIAAVHESAPNAGIRIDANQAFEPAAAVKFVELAQRITDQIELVEQPVAKENFEGLRYVKDRISLPLFADESARSYEDVSKLIEMKAVDGVNIKLMKSGIVGAFDIAALCKRSGIRLMVGCMLESPLGIAAAAALAGGLGGFEFIDLDSHKLLKPVKSLHGPFYAEGSALRLDPVEPGWGLTFEEGCD